jgi:hypothetical protein
MSVARLALFHSVQLQPDDDRRADSLRSLLRSQPGFRAGYHLYERESGRLISLTIFDTERDLRAAGAAVASRPKEDQRGINPDEVGVWEVTEF